MERKLKCVARKLLRRKGTGSLLVLVGHPTNIGTTSGGGGQILGCSLTSP